MTEAYLRWQKWLRGCSLLDTLSPDGVLELLSRVDATRARLSSLRDRRDRVAGIQRDIQEIGELVVSLAKKHDVPSDGDRPSTLVAAIAELALRLEKAQRELQEKKDDLQALNQAEERQNQEARHLDKAREDLSNLLHFGGTDDSEEFRRRTSIYNERKECERRLENHRTILRRLFGPDADLTTPRAEIDGRTVEPLQEAVHETEQSITDTESRRDGLRDEAVRVEQELAALSTSEEASALRAEREQRREELQRVAGQWAKFTVALGMLRLAREQYERERQPKVVQEAERFFSKVTGGRYTGLRAPVGESTINVIPLPVRRRNPLN
ncbi:MAG: hypothetical protein O6914_06780 [Chloroflexi bacterium]|nr:hypothetical protein [Chloroflexota bacterium]